MSSQMPLVSVVIPAYNAEKFIVQALDSLVAQTYPAVEVIVVDDGSRDATSDVVARAHPSVRCIRQPNGGASSARNRGVQEARGELVAFLDADDAWHPDKLRAQVALMRRHPDVLLSRTGLSEVPLTTLAPFPDVADGLPEHRLIASLGPSLLSPYFATSTVMVRRQAFLDVGAFDTALKVAEDVDLYLRILARCPKVLFLTPPAVFKRPVEGSLGDDDEEGYVQLLGVYERFLRAHPQVRREVGQRTVQAAVANLWARYAGSLRRAGKRGPAIGAAWRSLCTQPNALALRVLVRGLLP